MDTQIQDTSINLESNNGASSSPSSSSPTNSNKPIRRFHQRALIWDLEETRVLLDLLKDQRILKAIESVRTREIYHEISDRLKQAGYNRDWNQIRGRVKNLKFSYKKTRALNEEHGQSTGTCRFYDDLHQLFGHKYKRQRTKKRISQRGQTPSCNQMKKKYFRSSISEFNIENENGQIASNLNSNEQDELSDEDEESMNDDIEQRIYLDDGSSDYIHRPEDPYPTLQMTRLNPNSISDDQTPEHPEDQESPVANDEVDTYLKSISPLKHQAYLIDEILQSVFDKFLQAQEQFEQRFTSFLHEQKRDDQLREERIHREQRQHQYEILQLILNQVKSSAPRGTESHLRFSFSSSSSSLDFVDRSSILGRSHSTGEEGLYPLKNLRKTSETDSWTLQKSSSLTSDEQSSTLLTTSETQNSLQLNENQYSVFNGTPALIRKTSVANKSVTNVRSDASSVSLNPGSVRLFCVRHGERVDFAFGPSWPELVFDKSGNYNRINLNLPSVLPRRRNPLRDFMGDSPITEIGASQARLTGQALAENDCLAQYCYSSPALRCIQTAHSILQGMGIEDRVKIRIEPGLFEFLGWYERGLPSFFNLNDSNNNDDELYKHFNIDKTYRPIISLDKLSRDEKYLDYYNRSFKVTQQITDKHKITGANLFFIGHAATLEVCTRQLCSLTPRSYSEFNGVIRKVSYLAIQLCERNPSDGQWSLQSPPIPPIQHTNNFAFDWQSMK